MSEIPRRRSDRVATIVLSVALCVCVVAFAHAQISNDEFRGHISATVVANRQRLDVQDRRLDKIESIINWAAGGLIANLVAHIIQISTVSRRRREDDDRPRVSER